MILFQFLFYRFNFLFPVRVSQSPVNSQVFLLCFPACLLVFDPSARMAALPPEHTSDVSPPVQQNFFAPLSESTEVDLLRSQLRECSPSPITLLPSDPLKLSLSVPHRRHILWPAGNRLLNPISVPSEVCSDPAMKRSFSEMEASSHQLVEKEDYITPDPNKALVVYQRSVEVAAEFTEDEFWKVTFQDFKRLKADVAEGRLSQIRIL